jgi:Flp pilus assembly pilin Flp
VVAVWELVVLVLSLVARLAQIVDRGAATARGRGEQGQTTAEYALVILGAAAIAGLLIAWATDSGAIEGLFDSVIDRVAGEVG